MIYNFYLLTAKLDFISTPITVIFSPGQEEATIRVSTLYDTVVEDRETFTIVLSTNDLNTEVGGAVTVNIIDDDGIG